jgi:probable rRNA maturation factor
MIKVIISAESRYPVSRKKIRDEVREFLEKQGVTEASDIEVEIAFVGGRKIRSLNREFLGKDETTDVLAFPGQGKGEGRFVELKQKFLSIGSVVVCYPVVQVQANERNVLVDEEIKELVLHGLGHLLGIHHD